MTNNKGGTEEKTDKLALSIMMENEEKAKEVARKLKKKRFRVEYPVQSGEITNTITRIIWAEDEEEARELAEKLRTANNYWDWIESQHQYWNPPYITPFEEVQTISKGWIEGRYEDVKERVEEIEGMTMDDINELD